MQKQPEKINIADDAMTTVDLVMSRIHDLEPTKQEAALSCLERANEYVGLAQEYMAMARDIVRSG